MYQPLTTNIGHQPHTTTFEYHPTATAGYEPHASTTGYQQPATATITEYKPLASTHPTTETDTSHTVNEREIAAWATVALMAILVVVILTVVTVVVIHRKCKGKGRDDNRVARTQEYEMDGNPCYESVKTSQNFDTGGNVYEPVSMD